MNDLIKQLKSLRNIQPNQEFAERTKFSILYPPKGLTLNTPMGFKLYLSPRIFKLAAGLIIITVIVIAGNYSPIQQSALAGLSDQELDQEVSQVEKQIQQPELDYYLNSHQTIDAALTEIGNDQTKHINKKTLQKEVEGLDVKNPVNQNINDLLDEIAS